MTATGEESDDDGPPWTDSHGCLLVEFRDFDPAVDTAVSEPIPDTPDELLAYMRQRVRRGDRPLPRLFDMPPDIDLPVLLKQVPWPPAE